MPVECPFCNREFKGDKLNARHLSKCNPALKVPVPPCLCGHEATSMTQMKRHRRTCDVWQTRDKTAVAKARRKETSLERYGVEDARWSPEAKVQRIQTNSAKYGAVNPLSRESIIFEEVQEALVGKRVGLMGADNSFAKPEVQEKIREHWQREHGVDNPQQVSEIRAQTKATNLERYGAEEPLSLPERREQIQATNEERYGGPAPSCSPEVVEKARQTNLKRWGVPWTCQDPDVRRRQLETMEANWGGHFFASDEGKQIIRAALKERYGVEFRGAIEGHWGKTVTAFQERLGVGHPLQLEEFRAKQRATNLERYGYEYPIGSEMFFKACLRNAGVPIPEVSPEPCHPMKVREYARIHLERMRQAGPNLLERRVAAMDDRLLFTGDGKFWRWLPLLGRYKNPDFILPGPDSGHPKRGVIKVVEAFGDFWHSRIYTGKAPFEHEQELVAAFQRIGIDCLILWESEVKADPEGVAGRVRAFLG